MEFNIETLKCNGGFTGGAVKKVVEWEHDGEAVKADVWIRPMSYHTAVKDIAAIEGGSDLLAHRLAYCVRQKDGNPVFQVSDITGLDENGDPVVVEVDGKKTERGPLNKNLADALMILVAEVSGLGKTKRNSVRKKSSGTS